MHHIIIITRASVILNFGDMFVNLSDVRGFGFEERFCMGRTSQEFEKRWNWNLREIENVCWDLILEQYCEKLQVNLILKKVFEWFNDYLPHLQFKVFISYCNFQCFKFENACTLATLKKVHKNHMKMSNISQTFQDDYKNCKKKKKQN